MLMKRAWYRDISGIVLVCLLLLILSGCATSSSGLLGGGNWQTNGLQAVQLRVLAVNPNDPQQIYAGDEQGRVFMSANAGQQWQERSSGLPLSAPLYALSLDNAGKKLYAATEKGLFVSSDAAQHWQRLSPTSSLPATSYTALFFVPGATSRTIYVGAAQRGIFSSSDGGTNWHAASGGLPQGTTVNSLSFDPDLHQLWAATTSGLYRSSDQGASWQAFMNGLPTNITINAIQTAASSGGAQGLLYLGTNQGFYRSQDAGVHWQRGETPLIGSNIRTILVDFRSGSSGTVYIGSDLGALRSDDRGQNWQSVASGMPKGTTVYALALGATGYVQLYAAADKLYLFPGIGGMSDPKRIVPLVLILFFFYLLLRMTTRTRGRRRFPAPKQPPTPSH
jgi:ligand-binding sensor domain-containing protein